MSRLSARAASRSSRSFRRIVGETLQSGLAFLIVCHRSHVAGSPWRAWTKVLPREPSRIMSCHQPPWAGASVPIKTIRRREPGLPWAVASASYINSPPRTSQAPGSSATRSGQPTTPKAVRALLDRTRSRVRVGTCVAPTLVTLSMKRQPPIGSSASRSGLKTIRACSRLPASKMYSRPGRFHRCPGVSANERMYAASVDFPLPRGIDSAAVSVPGAKARAMKRRWNGRGSITRAPLHATETPSGASPGPGSRRCHHGLTLGGIVSWTRVTAWTKALN